MSINSYKYSINIRKGNNNGSTILKDFAHLISVTVVIQQSMCCYRVQVVPSRINRYWYYSCKQIKSGVTVDIL